mmetsp:Transcript_16716/g.31667  ORF Transcript_16716/g.31667 Transcript_16716/m.31667 type:complete len:1010 (-) Transcript_16716:8-3037(-)
MTRLPLLRLARWFCCVVVLILPVVSFSFVSSPRHNCRRGRHEEDVFTLTFVSRTSTTSSRVAANDDYDGDLGRQPDSLLNYDENISNGSSSHKILSKEIVDALDLTLVIENVMMHAATRRARDALLSLVVDGDLLSNRKSSSWERTRQRQGSTRKDILSSISKKSLTSEILQKRIRDNRQNNARRLIKVATTLQETREEWGFILEATNILKGHEPGRLIQNEQELLPLPPIYGMQSSPWDIHQEEADSDDDEWLQEILASVGGYTVVGSCLELENILQAEQVVKRIIKCYEWSQSEDIVTQAPQLSGIFKHVPVDGLKKVLEEIEGSVIVLNQGKARFSDSLDAKTYSFVLNEEKFPNLCILKKKERQVVEQRNKVMDRLFANKKFVAQLSGFTRKITEPYEMDGRLVVAASVDVAKKIGVIRGYSETRSFCFVEPKEVASFGTELQMIRRDIDSLTSQILSHLREVVVRDAGIISRGLNAVARLDVFFARAAYGIVRNGVIPHVGNSGVINVKEFMHPALVAKGSVETVPIDLNISDRGGERALIISGPNGGGKSLAMKSFGLVAFLTKLGIPIPVKKNAGTNDGARVDFFHDVIVELGDKQNLLEGESTYMAQLHSLSRLIQHVSGQRSETEENITSSTLILLDELGGGTDPVAGSSIAQAVLEKVLEYSHTRVIVTTHSTQLKVLSVNDDRFTPASVQLQSSNGENAPFRIPTYELCYGSIGDSCALAAASRTKPSFPNEVLDRAASLIAFNQDSGGEHMRIIIEALEEEKNKLIQSAEASEQYRRDILRCRDAAVLMARSYEQHLARIEERLESMLLKMKQENSRDSYDLVGDSLAALRLAKKAVVSKEDMLAEKGMRLLTMADIVHPGDNVVIVASGNFEGETAIVANDQSDCAFDEISLDIGYDSLLSQDGMRLTLKFKRCDLAMWDYPPFDDDWQASSKNSMKPYSIQDSKAKLFNALNAIKSSTTETNSKKQVTQGTISKFTSSRERKAANTKAKKTKRKL